MNIEKTINEQHQAEIQVELDPDQIARAKRIAAKRLSKRNRIPGFRPGKAPYEVIARYLGEGQILSEAIENLIEDLYPRVIEEAKINPYGPGQLQDIHIDADPPTAEFVVPLAPEIELSDYESIQKSYEPPETTDEMVEEFLQEIRETRANLEPVERAAQAGDQVRIRLHAVLEGEEEPLIDNQPFPVIIDDGQSDDTEEWPFPGFSQLLVGMQPGDKKEHSYTFPDDYESEKLAGQTGVYHIEVTEVNLRTLPELDDEFAKSIGEYETLADYREQVREYMETSGLERYQSDYQDELIEEIISGSQFKYPPEALDDEVKMLKQQLENRLASQGLNLETYMKTRDLDEDGLVEELRPTAEKRIRRSMVLLEVAEKQDIKVDPVQVEQEVNSSLERMFASVPQSEARKLMTQDFLRGLSSLVYNNALISSTLEHLRAMASGTLEESDDGVSEPPSEQTKPEPEAAAEESLEEHPDDEPGAEGEEVLHADDQAAEAAKES